MANSRLDWHPQGPLRKKGLMIRKAVLAICITAVTEIKTSMKSYGQYSIVSTRKTVAGYIRQRKGRKIRHYPAPPEYPPAVDTGRLRGSISINWSGSGMPRGKVEPPATANDGVGQYQMESPSNIGFFVTIGTNVKYAPYLEFGTRKMLPRPFLRPVYMILRMKLAAYSSQFRHGANFPTVKPRW